MNKIVLTNVVKNFRFDSRKVEILKGISLEIIKGETVIIKGKSGSGKSTLLNMITGIDKPDAGSISIFDTDIKELKADELVKWRGKTVGIIFQFFQLIPTLTVLENVMLPMELTGQVQSRMRKRKALELLEKVDIVQLQNKFPQTISGGEKQRVAIARSLANDPELIVADEPTGNLDIENTINIQHLFNQLANEGKTILYVTHERELHFEYSKKIEMVDGSISTTSIGTRIIGKGV